MNNCKITGSSSFFLTDKYIMKNKFLLSALIILFLVFSGSTVSSQTSSASTLAILETIAGHLDRLNYNEAIALFDTIEPADAESTPIRLIKASILNSAGQAREARLIVEDIISKEPGNMDAVYILSVIESASGRQREQLTALENIVRANPGNVDALTALASAHLQTRSWRNAISYFDMALEIDPQNLDALIGKATVYRLSRDPSNAEAMLNQAVRLHPDEAAPYHERARLYKGFGFTAQAVEDLERARERDPDDYWIAIDLGNAYLDMYRKNDAFEEFERAVRINPREFLAYAYTAGMKDEFGDLDGAERDYIMMASINPEYYFAFEGIGMHKMRKGEWALARDAFLEAYRQAPNEYHYALLAASSWMRADNIAAPRQFLNQAMARVRRESIDYYILRLYYDLSGYVYSGENDFLHRVNRGEDNEIRARMLFYIAQYYEIRGNTNLANRYYLQFRDLNQQQLPEWRLNEWIIAGRRL